MIYENKENTSIIEAGNKERYEGKFKNQENH